jgi:hypothetical protein
MTDEKFRILHVFNLVDLLGWSKDKYFSVFSLHLLNDLAVHLLCSLSLQKRGYFDIHVAGCSRVGLELFCCRALTTDLFFEIIKVCIT